MQIGSEVHPGTTRGVITECNQNTNRWGQCETDMGQHPKTEFVTQYPSNRDILLSTFERCKNIFKANTVRRCEYHPSATDCKKRRIDDLITGHEEPARPRGKKKIRVSRNRKKSRRTIEKSMMEFLNWGKYRNIKRAHRRKQCRLQCKNNRHPVNDTNKQNCRHAAQSFIVDNKKQCFKVNKVQRRKNNTRRYRKQRRLSGDQSTRVYSLNSMTRDKQVSLSHSMSVHGIGYPSEIACPSERQSLTYLFQPIGPDDPLVFKQPINEHLQQPIKAGDLLMKFGGAIVSSSESNVAKARMIQKKVMTCSRKIKKTKQILKMCRSFILRLPKTVNFEFEQFLENGINGASGIGTPLPYNSVSKLCPSELKSTASTTIQYSSRHANHEERSNVITMTSSTPPSMQVTSPMTFHTAKFASTSKINTSSIKYSCLSPSSNIVHPIVRGNNAGSTSSWNWGVGGDISGNKQMRNPFYSQGHPVKTVRRDLSVFACSCLVRHQFHGHCFYHPSVSGVVYCPIVTLTKNGGVRSIFESRYYVQYPQPSVLITTPLRLLDLRIRS